MISGPVPGSPSRATVVGIAAAAALVPLNSTMVAVALPRIAGEFDISVGGASVLITVYLVAMLVGQPLAGRVSDRVGPSRTVTVALVGFGGGSLAAAVAPNFVTLVLARGGQAVFAAALVPSVQSMLRALTPAHERGRVFGVLGSVLGVGAAGGPVIGGALTQLYDWRAIFVVNIPIVAAALAASFVIGETDGRTAPEAPTAPPAAVLNAVFVSAFTVQALSTVAQYALLLLSPIILHARGWSSGSIGLVLTVLTLGMIVTGPAGGRFGDRRGRRAPVLGGLALAGLATVLAAAAGADIVPVLLVLVLAAFGVGLGFATPSVMTAGLESVSEQRTGSAGGLLSTSRYVGSIATSVAVSVFVGSNASGSNVVLALSAVAMLVAWGFAWRLPARRDGGADHTLGAAARQPLGRPAGG